MNRTSSSRSLLDPRALITTTSLASLLLIGSGCGSIGEGPKGPQTDSDESPATADNNGGGNDANNGATGGAATGETPPPPAADPNTPSGAPCQEVTLAAKEVLKTNCTSCHGAGSVGKGGFANVLDATDLVTSKKVVPNKPDESPLYVRMSAGSMPPAATNPRPSAKDLTTMKDWILCGAPNWDGPGVAAAPFVTVNDRLSTILSDLRKITNPADRKRMRYIDLSTLSNAGFSADQVDEYREGVSLLLNSLSYGSVVVPGRSIDANKLLYRIDLRDYGWDAADWDEIVEDYPYVVQYNQDSRIFPFNEDDAEQIREETGTLAAYIQADWLIAHASQPPLYYQVLDLDGLTLDQIAASVGVNVQANIDAEQVARAGFINSGVSEQNRMMERHELPGRQGAFWLSYDFQTNNGFENLQAHPLDFQEAGGEGIFNLPNGLQAYFIINNQGTLLNVVPNTIATDPNSSTREVESAASCMGCHAAGIIRKDDTIGSFIRSAGVDAEVQEQVLALYIPVSEMQSLIDQDNDRYGRARTAANVIKFGELSMSRMVNTHERSLNLNQAAAVIGIDGTTFKNALSGADFPDEVRNLGLPGGLIDRETLEAQLGEILRNLGLGKQLDTPAVAN